MCKTSILLVLCNWTPKMSEIISCSLPYQVNVIFCNIVFAAPSDADPLCFTLPRYLFPYLLSSSLLPQSLLPSELPLTSALVSLINVLLPNSSSHSEKKQSY